MPKKERRLRGGEPRAAEAEVTDLLDATELSSRQSLVGIVSCGPFGQLRVIRDGASVLLRMWLPDDDGVFQPSARNPTLHIRLVDELCAVLLRAKEGA